MSLGEFEASSSHCHCEGERSSSQRGGGLLPTHPSSQPCATVPPLLLCEGSRGSKPKAMVGTWMLPIHYVAPRCQALDLGEKVAGERLPAAVQPASLAMGLRRWFAYGCLACPDNFCCLEDLSSLGQAQLISEFPVNKGKDSAYVTPLLDGSLASSRTAACREVLADRGGGLAVLSLPLRHPLRVIFF